jgi:signal transduction histidine kinase
MFSETVKSITQSAAWRISLWATLAFAVGTMIIFVFVDHFVASDIQRRTDAWLMEEAHELADILKRTAPSAAQRRAQKEINEFASRAVQHKKGARMLPGDSAFLLQTAPDGSMALWVGAGYGAGPLKAVLQAKIRPEIPSSLRVSGFDTPFRIVEIEMGNGAGVYLGLSQRDDLRVLGQLRLRFMLLWLLIVSIGSAIVFLSTRRVLHHIREITESASRIGEEDLSSRVPTSQRQDEGAQLALTLNRMLDRIESSVRQVQTITGSLAHDLRSPLTAVRAKLEMALTRDLKHEESESIVSAIEDLDRLTEFLDQSLDVAEAKANALKLDRVELDLDEILRVMRDLYEPGMSEKGLEMHLSSVGAVRIHADAPLIHRMIANLFDNELKHLPPSCNVKVSLQNADDAALLIIEDNGPGFEDEIRAHLFESRVKGRNSSGHGLGLAFVDAVVRAHGGTIEASRSPDGGARLAVRLPRALRQRSGRSPLAAVASA